jgi:hypothetical protein
VAAKPALSRDARRQAAKDLFNLAWVYIRKRRRTPEDDEAMLDAAYASRHFWREFATPGNHAISEWQLARVHAEVHDAAGSMRHARRALAICKEHRLEPWQLAFAYEAVGRAHLERGAGASAGRALQTAERVARTIGDAGDRRHTLAEIAKTQRLVKRRRRQ